MRQRNAVLLLLGLLVASSGQARDAAPDALHAPGLTAVDAYTLKGETSFLTGHPPINPDGTVNVVVEIPAGTTAKWEVKKPSGELRVLGPAVARGSVVRARVIGVLKLLDGGEQDDKILAVLAGDPLAEATSVRELDEKFPGVSTIIETWFESYKGPGELESQGFAGPTLGMQIVEAAARAFTE